MQALGQTISAMDTQMPSAFTGDLLGRAAEGLRGGLALPGPLTVLPGAVA